MSRELPIPYCFYGLRAQKLPLPVLERIVQASRQIAEAWSCNHDSCTWDERGTNRRITYEQYDAMRYQKMVQMLTPDVTEEQIAIWDLEKDPRRIMSNHLHLYNMLVKCNVGSYDEVIATDVAPPARKPKVKAVGKTSFDESAQLSLW